MNTPQFIRNPFGFDLSKINLRVIGAALLLEASLGFVSHAEADELTLYFIPSPFGVNWNSPRALLDSTLEDFLFSEFAGSGHEIGHVYEDVECESTGTHATTGMTGATGSDVEDVLFKQELGLGMLFHTFSGSLDTESFTRSDLAGYFKSGLTDYITWKISPTTCARLMEYFDEYVARGYENFYGLSNRPRYGEGAGCSAFGESFLEIAGLDFPDYKNSWQYSIRAPSQLVGGPLTNGQKVSVLDILFKSVSKHWAAPNAAGFDLDFWSPDSMYQWVQKVWKGKTHTQQVYTKVKNGKALGLVMDATDVPTPTDPIWKN